MADCDFKQCALEGIDRLMALEVPSVMEPWERSSFWRRKVLGTGYKKTPDGYWKQTQELWEPPFMYYTVRPSYNPQWKIGPNTTRGLDPEKGEKSAYSAMLTNAQKIFDACQDAKDIGFMDIVRGRVSIEDGIELFVTMYDTIAHGYENSTYLPGPWPDLSTIVEPAASASAKLVADAPAVVKDSVSLAEKAA